MTGTQRRTRIKSGIIMTMALVFLIALFAFSLTLGREVIVAEADDYERLPYETVSSGVVSDFFSMNDAARMDCNPSGGVVSTPLEFCYVFLMGTTGNYTLGKNFKITADSWSAGGKINNNTTTLLPKLVKGCTVNGNGFTVWNNAIPQQGSNYATASKYSSFIGGLISQNDGIIENLKYYFTGSLYVKKISTSEFVAVGGMIGKNNANGKIRNCTIAVGGEITAEGDTEECTVIGGGMIGYNEGSISGCSGENGSISSSGSISVYSDMDTDSSNAKHSVLYGGGLIGKMGGGSVDGCDVKCSAAVMTADNTDKWAGTIGGLIESGLGLIGLDDLVDVSTEYNDAEHYHPAGVVVGAIAGNGSIKNSNLDLTGSALSYGLAGSSNSGDISGGVVGLLESTCTAQAGLQSNQIKLNCALSAFYMQSFSLTGELIDWVSSKFGKGRTITIYLGATFGRCDATALGFKNNFIYVAKDAGIIEDGADYESDVYSVEGGLLCGNDGILALIGENNWLVRNPAKCETDKIIASKSDVGALKQLDIFGDGDIAVAGSFVSSSSFTVEANPICSPFYGWTADMVSPSFTKTRTLTLSSASPSVEYAVFIDTDVRSSGELTQLAYDINLIKKDVWKGVTLSWLNVSLGEDILVEKGTPVIEDFYGTFSGDGHTLSFAAGSKISHDYEQPAKEQPGNTRDNRATSDYETVVTGLFGAIHGTVGNLNILFGGSIVETGGLNYYSLETYKSGGDDDGKVDKDTGDLLKANKRRETDDGYFIADRVQAYGDFKGVPDSIISDFTKVEVYFLTGEGYKSTRAYNPGYIEVVPCFVEVVTENTYVGILAGANYGRVFNVNVEATNSAYVGVASDRACFGVLCGLNKGSVDNCSASFCGKATLTAGTEGYFGGMFGKLAMAGATTFTGLNANVSGEISVQGALRYHKVTVYEYNSATTASGEVDTDETMLPDGYTCIAYDYDDTAVDEKSFEFGCKGLMSTSSYKIPDVYGDAAKAIKEMIGTLVGYFAGADCTFTNVAAVAGEKSTFNTPVYFTDAYDDESKGIKNNYVGAVVGYLNTDSGNGIPTFKNTWAVMGFAQFEEEENGRLVIGSGEFSVKTGVNLVYVQKTIAVAKIGSSSQNPISFTLQAKEGLTFSGWYTYDTISVTGTKHVVTEGLQGDVFTPTTQKESNQIFVAEVISLQLFTAADFATLAASTNEGRGYLGVTFTVGGDGIGLSGFTPIGTEEHPFLGTLDGNGLSVRILDTKDGKYAALFGCVGSEGVVRNITVKVEGVIGNDSTEYGAAVVALNKGTVGQDLSTGKVIAEINNSITAKQVGGIVGVNQNVVKNAEVVFGYENDMSYGNITIANVDNACGGGAIGYNLSAGVTAYAKNIIVTYQGAPGTEHITISASGNKKYAAGGVIGKNSYGAAAYSLVCVVNDDSILEGSKGSASQFCGYLIGYNESANLDSLWLLYLSAAEGSSGPSEAKLGAPVSIYTGEDETVNTNNLVLLNGEKCNSGNALVRYGRGKVEVSVSGAEADKGGKITFSSRKLTTEDAVDYTGKALSGAALTAFNKAGFVDFYDYVADFYTGARVPVAEGNNGYTFTPTVGTSKTDGLTGKIYYAGFCNASIANQSDYEMVQANIDKDYRLYVEYNVTNNFTLDASVAKNPIGNGGKPFRGSINGNAYTVTMISDSLHAFVGVLGSDSDEECYSKIKNLRLLIQAGSGKVESESDVAHGFLTDSNYGVISGVSLTVRGYLKNEKGTLGAVAGENYGVIDSAIVVFDHANYLGSDGFGCLIGKTVGAIAGENYGVIGNDRANSIDVTVKKNAYYSGALYGRENVGGVVGVNNQGGVIRSVLFTLSGQLMGKNASCLAGSNLGEIKDAFVTVEKGATYFGTETFGMFAGVNSGVIGASGQSELVKGYLYAAPKTDKVKANLGISGQTAYITTSEASVKMIGGAVGNNAENGECYALAVELHSSLIATETAGGIIGENSGILTDSTLLTSPQTTIRASKAGGLTGVNKGMIFLCFGTTRGAIGAVEGVDYAGGFAAKNEGTGSVTTSVMTICDDVYGTNAGLAAATSNGTVSNAWVQVCNRSVTKVSASENTGFNAIRVLNETLLTIDVDRDREVLTFTSQISGVKNWYYDISAWTSDYGILKEGLNKPKLVFTPDKGLTDQEYYVSYDNLSLNNLTALKDLATRINSHDYYNDVLFRLGANIVVPEGTVLRPIGTESNPFNARFDGNFHTITLSKGSGISGAEYAGLFGYVASDSVISNFLLVINEGVNIGSVNSFEVGALVGRNYGQIKNVFVNLSSSITSNSQKRYVGAMVGYQAKAEGAPDIVNSWISILNEAAPAVGNMTASEMFGVNYIGVLGNGETKVEFAKEYEVGTEETIRFRCYVPDYKDAMQTDKGRAYFRRFDGWYSGVAKEENKVTKSSLDKYGTFVFNDNYEASDAEISFTPLGNVSGKYVTLSFIKFTIDSESGFREFADNINTYGDQGAKFTLEADITVDFTDCASVGTAERPFTGTFDGNGYTITVTRAPKTEEEIAVYAGEDERTYLGATKREYAGVFGYVGVGGKVQNLMVDASGAVFGDEEALYSGIVAALLFGELNNVVARADKDTVVYTTQGLASSGGLVGRAGKINKKDPADSISYTITNAWLVLAEGATVTNAVGEDPDTSHPDFYRENKETYGVGRSMRIVGELPNSDLRVEFQTDNTGEIVGIKFDAIDYSSKFYGFIDNAETDEEKMKSVSDGYSWTVKAEDLVDSGNKPIYTDMLCVVVNRYIGSVADLLELADNVSKGRNYRGIKYELNNELVIKAADLPNGVFTPIGGEVRVQSGVGYEEYVERNFIGCFDGKGKTIRFASDVVISSRYAGLFGRIGAEGRVRDLVVEMECKIGYDTEVNTTRTLYAGALAAYALGGSYQNVVVILDKTASLYGSVSTGRAFGYLPREAGNVATHCWAVSYNSKENYELNAAEILYNEQYKTTFDAWLVNMGIAANAGAITPSLYERMLSADRYADADYIAAFKRWAVREDYAESPEAITDEVYAAMLANQTMEYAARFERDRMPAVGNNQGGFNNLMVVAAGSVQLNYTSAANFNFSYDDSYWYALNDFDGTPTHKENGKYAPAKTDSRIGYNVSFLQDSIGTLAALKKFAENVNEGYNFYNLTFKLTADITIDKNSAFEPIGNVLYGMNGTFDGQGHTITVADTAVIEGEYAGLFGHVSSDGVICNLRVVANGTYGKIDYTADEIKSGRVFTLYAGTVAYNQGRLENVIVISGENTALKTRDGYAGLVLGYDKTNLVKNVWALVDASSKVNTVGRADEGKSGVNTMLIIGIGEVDATFKDFSQKDYRVRFEGKGTVGVMGWYKSFEDNQQISAAMLEPITEGEVTLKNGKDGFMIAPGNLFGVTYEVAVIKTLVTEVKDLIAIAGDVNKGGYSFESITFTLGANLVLPSASGIGYLSIGTEESPFKGTFLGSHNGTYYTLTVKKDFGINAIFGYNAGTVGDLTVIVNGTVGEDESDTDQIYGVIAMVNKGLIRSSYVEIKETGSLIGYTVGAVAGKNLGTVEDCVAVVRGKILAKTSAGNAINAGGLVGLNEGTVIGTTDFADWEARNLLPRDEGLDPIDANLYLFGEIDATASSNARANAGGAIGNHYSGTISSVIVYVTEGGLLNAISETDGARAGGLVGYARSSINHSVTFAYGTVQSNAFLGDTAGYFDGVTAYNTWQVTKSENGRGAVGSGAKSINKLTVKGNGRIKVSVDRDHNIIFINATEKTSPKKIVGWYTASNVEVDEKTGNVSDGAGTFKPLTGVQNKEITVIFVNTEINSLSDLIDMASSVSGGLSGKEIKFVLKKDLTITTDALAAADPTLTAIPAIGTKEYPFNNIFDGNGKTITFADGRLLPQVEKEYYGLFGYVSSEGLVENLKLVAEAGTSPVYGREESERTALLAAYNEGTIKNVTVTIKTNAILTGNVVGAVAASSFGTVETVEVNLDGSVIAIGNDNTVVAGGVVGANDGLLSGVTVTAGTKSAVSASGAATAYASVVAGENYDRLALVQVTFKGALSVEGSMSAYAGVVAGLNLGDLTKTYVLIKGGNFGQTGVTGGLVGNNLSGVSTSLIEVVGTDLTATDSAIGFAKIDNPDKVNNVWVYSDRIGNVSSASCVNSMIYEAGRTLSCPTAEEVLKGKIAFSSAITSDKKKADLFAVVKDGTCAAGSGAAMDNVRYAGGKIYFDAYDLVGSTVVVRPIVNVRVCLVSRDVVSSGSELYAYALAVKSGVYTFENATVTLGADFILPEREFPLLSVPSGLTLDGAHHVVTVGKAVLSGALIQTNDGTVCNLGLRYTQEGSVDASLVKTNKGKLQKAVVYLERGVTVASGKYFVTSNSGTATDLWLVVREGDSFAAGAVSFSVMRINGVGSLAQGGGNGLTFTAQTTEEGMIFVGYTDAGGHLSSDAGAVVFDTAGKAKATYTAEFLSVNLDSDYKLKVLSDVSLLGYDGKGTTFTMNADLTVTETLFGGETPFLGVLNGNGHKLIADAGVKNSLLGTFAGEIKDVLLDLRALSETEVTIFGGNKTVKLTRVVVAEDRDALKIGATVTANNVWIQSGNKTLLQAFMDSSIYDAYSLLYANGESEYAFDSAITVTAVEGNAQVFAGYFAQKGASAGSVGREKTYRLTGGANVVTLNFINRTLSSAEDLTRLANGVMGGFDFAGETFVIKDNGFTVLAEEDQEGAYHSPISTIGDETHPFKGSILGGNRSEIRFAANGATTFTVLPLIYRLYGTLGDVIFRYEQGAVFAEGAAATLVTENRGLMSAVVVTTEGKSLFTEGAALTLENNGETVNCWFITKGTERAVGNGSLVGVNELRLLTEESGKSVVLDRIGLNKTSQGTKVNLSISATTDHFLCFYDFDGNVVFPANYTSSVKTYTAPVNSSGVKLALGNLNVITKQDELVYLGYHTKVNTTAGFTVTLGDDLTVDRHLNTLSWNNYVLDLGGHVLTLAATTEKAETLLEGGTVRNGSILLSKGHYGIASEGSHLQNVALFLWGMKKASPVTTLPVYDLNKSDVKVVSESALTLVATNGSYSFLYAPKGADLTVTFDEEQAMTPVGKDNDRFYFGSFDSLSATEDVAYFAPVEIASEADYLSFVTAANGNATNLAHAEITLAANVTVDGTKTPKTLTYAGKLFAGGHSVTISGGTFDNTYLILSDGGAVSDLALVWIGATISAGALVSCGEESRIAVVVYQSDKDTKHIEPNATVMNVYRTTVKEGVEPKGEVLVTFGDTITFTAVQSGVYALKNWADADGNDLGRNLVQTDGRAVAAHFDIRYLVTVDYVLDNTDLTKEEKTLLLTNNAANLPQFGGIGILFASELEKKPSTPITVTISNIGKGFLFRSLSYQTKINSLATDAGAFNVAWTVGSYDIALTATLTYVRVEWEKVLYTASGYDVSTVVLTDLRDSLTAAGYTVRYEPRKLGDTPDLVDDKPYHAGTYLVSFKVYSSAASGKVVLCDAYGGLEITPAILTFKSLTIKDKVYDGTVNAQAEENSLELQGFKGDDKTYISFAGLTFVFADANAESGKSVRVGADALLAYAAGNEKNGEHRYAYLDYAFDLTQPITTETGVVRADITPRPLRLYVNSMTVEYLDQFDPAVAGSVKLRPTLGENSEDLLAADQAAFDAVVDTLLTRENPTTYDVGYYRIIVGNSFAMPNYTISLIGDEAYFIVEPSLVKVVFDDDDTAYYGDAAHTPKYHIFVGKAGDKTYRGLREGDQLYFTEVVYNDGRELLPNVTAASDPDPDTAKKAKYSFTCLFSAQNVNYKVEATEYRASGGRSLPVLKGENTLVVSPKPIKVVGDDERNTKRIGKRSETLYASLEKGYSFVDKSHTLVVTRAAGETVGSYLLSYAVKDADGKDITDRYEITTARAGGYFFTITSVVIRIKPNKTDVTYGKSVPVIKYGASVEGGGITLADLYYALYGTEKQEVTLKDLGIEISLGYSDSGFLPVGIYNAEFSYAITVADAAKRKQVDEAITLVASSTENMIVVQKRYVTVTIKDFTKTYDGVKDFNESKIKFEVELETEKNGVRSNTGIIKEDQGKLEVRKKSYRLLGDGVTVGMYKIDGEFEIVAPSEEMANNYYITVVQGNFTINPSTVKIKAEVGYFDKDGEFTPASITLGGEEEEYTIYYGDSKAILYFSVVSSGNFLKIPDGTDKEKSDYLVKELKISYYRLNRLDPFMADSPATDTPILGLSSANNNVEVSFQPCVSISDVNLTIKLLPVTKVVGEPDPEIEYELIAKDSNFNVIDGYKEQSEGTFDVIITADREQGETIGSYAYRNVKVDIINLLSGESLFRGAVDDEEEEEGDTGVSEPVKDIPSDFSLVIEQKEFLKTTLGKILIYGGGVFLLAVAVVLLLVLVPRARRKKRARKQFSAAEMWQKDKDGKGASSALSADKQTDKEKK